jgi:subtilisin family serine protease
MKKLALGWLWIIPFAMLLALPAVAQASKRQIGKLSAKDRRLLTGLRGQGKPNVTLLIAAQKGATSDVVSEIEKATGIVRFRDDEIDYIRAVVPLDRAERVAGLAGVAGLKVDEEIPLDDPMPVGGEGSAAPPPQMPGSNTPALNPYMPTKDIGAPQFMMLHPRYDGRGVKIAIVDAGVDVLTPELRSAKTLNGLPVRKIVDWVNMNDPLASVDPSWVDMNMQVQAADGEFTVNSITYSGVQGEGLYQFGTFDESAVNPGSELQQTDYDINIDGVWCADINRNGMCNESFGVLWNMQRNTVWVDSNADLSFENEVPMTDYRLRYDIGLFGVDDPSTPLRESVPFVVQTNSKEKFVNIGIVAGAHGTHVAGIAAGKKFFGGAINGVAPEAQIVSIRVCRFSGSCPTYALLEGMIFAAERAKVDVINMSIGGLSKLNDGESVFTELYNRLIDSAGVQMFISAGNAGPGINTVADPSTTSHVMSVGAYITKDTWFSNYGVDAVRDEGLFTFSSRGPTEAGGFKPNIVAPGAAVSSIPGWLQAHEITGTYQLPPGYAMFSGTSMAAPEATGGAALLISAAKQSGTPYDPERLRRAINSSSRFLPAYGAHEQGNGLFQISAAWGLLRTRLNAYKILSQAPVKTVLSGNLETPDTGTGIYQRESWRAGDSRVLNIVLTRSEGGLSPIRYNLTWVGNDGTFHSANSVWLERNIPFTLPVTVNPQTAGVHSAILNLADMAGTGFDCQILNTVVAAEQVGPANGGVVSFNASVDRPEKSAFFINVPESASSITVDLKATSGAGRVWAITPEGVPYNYTDYTTDSKSMKLTSSIIPGVWEFTVETSASSAGTPAVFLTQVTLRGATIEPAVWTIDAAIPKMTYTKTFTLINELAPFTGGISPGSLASNFRSRPTLLPDQSLHYDLTVPSTQTIIRATAGNYSDPSAIIDLYLYDCTAGIENCTLKTSGVNVSISANFLFAYANKAGLWRIMVVPRSIPSGSTEIDYSDTMNDSINGYGAIVCSDPARLHPSGDVWTVNVSVTPGSVPEPGRFIQGEIYLRESSNNPYYLASAEIIVN